MQSLLIYTSKITPRFEYILNVILQPLQLNFQITDKSTFFTEANCPKLNYSSESFDNCLRVVPHGILSDSNIKDYPIEVHKDSEFQFYFFKTGSKSYLTPFDVFGAAFWLLTRYEEYLPYKGDHLNRFHYKNSLAWQSGFIHRPLINEWLISFTQKLKTHYPELFYQLPDYRYTHTIDIDTAYKFKYKGLVRTFSGLLKSLFSKNNRSVKQRLNVVLGKIKDPYDVYEYLQNIHTQIPTQVIFFFLLGDYGLNDKNHSSTNAPFQTLIKHISDYHETGIHPSFKSNFNDSQLKIECQRLTHIHHLPVAKSRQHYSMLRFPTTYSALVEAGIKHDYSMGYNECLGFRASFCYPYKWYNLEEEQVTPLTIHPFAFNETAFAFSKNVDALIFLDDVEKIKQQVNEHGGELIGVFHNDSFALYKEKNYTLFYEKLLRLCNNHKTVNDK
jgi:hypothetical protein